MPHLRGITVHVTDSYGKNLQEWGIQYLRQQTEGKRVSAYVQSTTDVSFQVSLQPDIPFIGHDPQSNALGGEHASSRKELRHLKANSEDRSTDSDHGKKSNNSLSSPVRPSTTPQNHSAPDFALLAVLYLDGRRIPERKIISMYFRCSLFALFGLVLGPETCWRAFLSRNVPRLYTLYSLK